MLLVTIAGYKIPNNNEIRLTGEADYVKMEPIRKALTSGTT
jgi:hypothetical protein